MPTAYDDLIQRYLTLASNPRIYVSLPIPIPFGTDGPDNGVFTSAVVDVIKAVAVKYALDPLRKEIMPGALKFDAGKKD